MTAGEIVETHRSWKDQHAKELFEYERLMQRVLAQNALVWQTPSLGLAAQAFVLTTSLNGRTDTVPRCLASVLGVLLALMTMQLMAKHRYLLQLDQARMRQIETAVGIDNLADHHRETPVDDLVDKRFYTRIRSSQVWQVGLFTLMLVHVAVLVLALVAPSVLTTP
ncbi:hypothetical protein GCM10027451_32540 [Geodermatophilus aquaeductus]|uniref:Uncharacterized protein n=1 Tax=Geodermatophilus aquaeductus TaxID=1564161 RepID=A0A521EZE2_9ACTN|nr:hypothetical protein [Geodermatophilus aquaeductus]SMO89279.1 hypothetical protein SAMN06273567_106183 [Geodermatophilus aquaeductus]